MEPVAYTTRICTLSDELRPNPFQPSQTLLASFARICHVGQINNKPRVCLSERNQRMHLVRKFLDQTALDLYRCRVFVILKLDPQHLGTPALLFLLPP